MRKIRKPLKKSVIILAYLFCILTFRSGFSQNVGISASAGFTPDNSAGLDISYTNKGLLIPRVALTTTNSAAPVSAPSISLLVYNTTAAGTSPNNVIPGYYYWNGSSWVLLTTSAQTSSLAWSLTGNTGTGYPKNYLGSTDNFGLHFKTAGTHRLWLDSLGSVAVGTSPVFSTSREMFLVDAGITSSFNVMSGKGNINNYLQLNIQNFNTGNAASSDVVASADNGNESNNYVDLGINSSGNTSNNFGNANDAYLYNAGGTLGGNFYIGTSTTGKSLGLLTGGNLVGIPAAGTTAANPNNERIHIDGTTGNVGINNIGPTEKLDVVGNLKFSGALMPNNNAGTAGYFLQSAGSAAPPIWLNAGTLITSQAWGLTGNTGTNYKTNFLGTTDNAPLRIRTNNIERVIIDSLGSVGIGSEAFDPDNREKLLVDAGTTSSNTLINATGSINSFLQFNIQNTSTGTLASTDIVATANNGSDAAGYIDMGINSGSYTTTTGVAGITTKPNTAYIYSNAADLVIGNGATNKNIILFTNSGIAGTTTPNGTERMRIDGATGNVGIGTGTTTPAQKLDVVGSIRTTAGSITVDATASNTGTLSTALLFGSTASGEGISSKRTSGTNQNGLDFYTSSNNRMSITNAGNVGIGTNNPRYPLEIATKIAYTSGTYSAYTGTDGWSSDNGFSYYANGSTSSTAGASTGGSSTFYSIVTAGRIAAKEFNAYSDKREKVVIGLSDGKADMALLNQLKITDYTWIDKIGKSPLPEKKLIAQELRAVYPQAVKLIPGFIPSIYQKPASVKFDSTKKSMTLNFAKAHNSRKGDVLRIYVFDKLHEVTVKEILSSSELIVYISDNIADPAPYAKDIFVFGKRVDDYHTVDYDAVSMLNVSATQELYRQLEQQKQENKKAIDDLKKQLEDQNAKYQVQQSQIKDLKKVVLLSNSVIERQKQIAMLTKVLAGGAKKAKRSKKSLSEHSNKSARLTIFFNALSTPLVGVIS